MTWVFLTGEYPPDQGGVADYTRQVAIALAELGDKVHVWAPSCAAGVGEDSSHPVMLRHLPDFGRKSLTILEKELECLPQPFRLVVQYVPLAFGWKGMNVPFCLWLSRQKHPLWIIFHEVCAPFGWKQRPRHNLLAVVTRWSASLAAKCADRIYITIPAWRALLPAGTQCRNLPVPANCATDVDALQAAEVRRKLAPTDSYLIGHFGTYGSSIAAYLRCALPPLLSADPNRRVVLLGKNGEAFATEMVSAHPVCRGRLAAPGFLGAYELSCHLAACDVVLQPYPDGVSGRRASLMASLALGLPILTTTGHLTESFWGLRTQWHWSRRRATMPSRRASRLY